jgi:hypothetical protein
MTPVHSSKLPMGSGSFAFTGEAAALEHGYEIAAAGATFAMTGTAADLTKGGGTDRQFGAPNSNYINRAATARQYMGIDSYLG